jgi:3-phosphoshikimate 1-carboxyvinyltransferase
LDRKTARQKIDGKIAYIRMTQIKEIQALEKAEAEIIAPASKSYTNRALVIASLADGRSILNNPLLSDDTGYMSEALKKLGIEIAYKDNSFIVDGKGGNFHSVDEELFIGNAGTAMRFLTSLAALVPGKTTIKGNEHMQKRPIKDLLAALEQLGIKTESNDGFPPVTIENNNLTGNKTKLRGDKSSQYLTSLLMVSPYLDETVHIDIEAQLTSRSYVDITLDIMKTFGVSVKNNDYRSFDISNKQRYTAKEYNIEGDASSASYFFAAAAITKGKVKITNLNPNSAQGDIRFPDILSKMGCTIEKQDNQITLQGDNLKGIEIDMNLMPDTVQTLAIVALFAKGKTTIRNIENLRIKETNRITNLAKELRKLGAEIKETKDSIIIIPKENMDYSGTEIETYDDHRMAMSFSIAGLKIPKISIKNPECVSKSFPDYWDIFQRLYD